MAGPDRRWGWHELDPGWARGLVASAGVDAGAGDGMMSAVPTTLHHHETDTTSVVSMYATAFVFDEAGRVLLIRENYGDHRYGPPGGGVDEGESPQDAAVREALEEAGVVVEVEHLVGIRWAVRDGRRYLGFGFRCRLVDGTPHIRLPDEIAEVGWFDPEHLPAPATNMLQQFALPARQGERGLVTSQIL